MDMEKISDVNNSFTVLRLTFKQHNQSSYTFIRITFYLSPLINVQPHYWTQSPPGKCPPIQYIPRNMHTVFAFLCFVVIIHWLIFPYPSGLLHWHCDNRTIAPVPAKQPWWIWINTSCEFIMNDCITTTKQNTTKPCAYFLGYTVDISNPQTYSSSFWLYIAIKTTGIISDIRPSFNLKN